MRKINSGVMKRFNLMQVVRTVQRRGPISRTALAEQLGLTVATVTNLSNDLVEAGILCQAGHDSTGALGRRAVMVDVNPSAFYSLGVEMNNCSLVVGLADFRGEIQAVRTMDFDAQRGVEETLQELETVIRSLLADQRVPLERVLGMGMALPGPLDSKAGVLRSPPNMPLWKNVPICAILSDRLQIPVCCDRETNAAALAESLYGVSAGRETSYMLGLFTRGIGGGCVYGGRVLRGFCDGAGEIGHTTVVTGGAPCACGGYGCLETVVSGDVLVEQVRRRWRMTLDPRAASQGPDLTLKQLFDLARQGEPVCRRVVEEAAAYVAMALRNIINTISPEIIVLSGPMAFQAGFADAIREQVRRTPYPPHGRTVAVELTAFGDRAFVKGGVTLAMDAFLEEAVLCRCGGLSADGDGTVVLNS